MILVSVQSIPGPLAAWLGYSTEAVGGTPRHGRCGCGVGETADAGAGAGRGAAMDGRVRAWCARAFCALSGGGLRWTLERVGGVESVAGGGVE